MARSNNARDRYMYGVLIVIMVMVSLVQSVLKRQFSRFVQGKILCVKNVVRT